MSELLLDRDTEEVEGKRRGRAKDRKEGRRKGGYSGGREGEPCSVCGGNYGLLMQG